MEEENKKMTPDQIKLVEDNLKLAHYAAHSKGIYVCKGDYEEALSIAYEALCKASIHYSPESGVAFSTYALRTIYNAYIHTIRVMSTKKRKTDQLTVSLSSPLRDVDDMVLQDIIPDSYDMEESVLTTVGFNEVVDSLSPRDREVFDCFLNSKGETTCVKIGETLGVSKQRAHQKLRRLRQVFSQIL